MDQYKLVCGPIHKIKSIHKSIQNIFGKNIYRLGNILTIPNFIKIEKSPERTTAKCEQCVKDPIKSSELKAVG